MNPLVGDNEFTLTDKLENPAYLDGRLNALRRLYRKDKRLAREIVSYAWPHERERPWTHSELRAKLYAQGGEKMAALLLKEAASEFLYNHLPSVGAAFDAFDAERAHQDAIEAQREAQRYPSMAFTQPMAQQYAMGGGLSGMGASPAPTHHRHRRHHHG